jgi:hypothetical protein
MNLTLGPLQAHLSRDITWVRLFGFGVKVKDTRRVPPIFSERHGRTLRVGPLLVSACARETKTNAGDSPAERTP